jgi:hypothetical protein
MAWDWLGSTSTGLVGIAGIAATLKASGMQAKSQAIIAQKEHNHRRTQKIRDERRVLYAQFLSALNEQNIRLVLENFAVRPSAEPDATGANRFMGYQPDVLKFFQLSEEVELIGSEKTGRIAQKISALIGNEWLQIADKVAAPKEASSPYEGRPLGALRSSILKSMKDDLMLP